MWSARFDLPLYKGLDIFLIEGVPRDFVHNIFWNNHNAITVANENIAGDDGDTAATDRQISIDGRMRRQRCGRRRTGCENRKTCFNHSRRVAHAAVGDHAGTAALLDAFRKYIAERRAICDSARIDHQDRARRYAVDGNPLRIVMVRENSGVDKSSRMG